jgi:hypothetical protein
VGGFNPSDDIRKVWVQNGIDSFVIEHSSEYLDRYKEYCDNLMNKKNVLFLKYEQMITSFDRWFEKFISVFPLTQKNAVFSEILKNSSSFFQIKEENKYNHIRQVSPGDHKRKLRKETVEFLSIKFKSVLEKLEYAF